MPPTCWPSGVNAHPHYSTSERIAIIHNGIIENYAALKTHLQQQGHVFQSDTDTEVFVNLIEEIQKQNSCSLEEAVRLALHEVVGAYATGPRINPAAALQYTYELDKQQSQNSCLN